MLSVFRGPQGRHAKRLKTHTSFDGKVGAEKSRRQQPKRRLPSTEAMGAGGAFLGTTWETVHAIAGSLPSAIQTPATVVLSAIGSFVAGVGYIRYRRGKKKDANRSQG
ncbi:MAG TPA: hypothetical protein VF053_11630 [Streptosporangiales bacterium]